MPSIPPLPPWEGMHPLVVHFPIALLMVAPIFVIVSAVSGSRAFMLSTLLLMVLGVASAYVATRSGDEAQVYMEVESLTGYEVAEEHKEVAEWARDVFLALTIVYAVIVALSLAFEKARRLAPRLALNLLFLLPWAYGLVVLAQAAHLGGHLVHEFGVQAPLAGSLEVEEEDVDEEGDYEDTTAPEDDSAIEDPAAGDEDDTVVEGPPTDDAPSTDSGEEIGAETDAAETDSEDATR